LHNGDAMASSNRAMATLVLAAALAVGGCEGIVDSLAAGPTGSSATPRGPGIPEPVYEPGLPVLPRLTVDQYRRSVEALLGDGIPETPLEADTTALLFSSIDASTTTISERGVQQWEEAATAAAQAVIEDPERRATLLGCTPTSADDGCVRAFVERFGRRAYRRPLEIDEVDRWMDLVRAESDVTTGVGQAIAGILQSPLFVYRIELGSPDPVRPGWNRLETFELATRIAFTLWGSGPDEALLDAAARGALEDEAGLRAEATRMLDDPRARPSVREFFREYLALGGLDALERDPILYPTFTRELGTSMRGEIERAVEHVVFEEDGDFRAIFDTGTTFVDARLAELYDITLDAEALATADAEGFVRISLPSDGPRGGLITMAGFLSANSHPNLTSPTRRGKFVRERLLCELVSDPPPDVPLVIEEEEDPMTGVRRTLRERLTQHREDPVCATCHAAIDPIGLGMEDFDAIGAHRTIEADAPVDANGDLDGVAFFGGRELGELLRHDERVPGCVARQLFRRSVARVEDRSEEPAIAALIERFAASGYSFRSLLLELVTSEAFRTVRTPEDLEMSGGAR
jgi:hypothetical protein